MSCRGNVRHWFAYYGWVGSSAPTCRHCDSPNPRYDPERDPHPTRVFGWVHDDPSESVPEQVKPDIETS